jgi:hypothetical protein
MPALPQANHRQSFSYNHSLCRSWFGHYATSRDVAGSSPDEVDIFNWPNPSSRTMALVSTQPLTETSTRNLPGAGGGGGKGRPARKADNLTAICEPIVLIMWDPRRLTILWAFTACYRDSFTFFFYLYQVYVRTVLCNNTWSLSSTFLLTYHFQSSRRLSFEAARRY